MRLFRLRAAAPLSFRQKLIAVSIACILLPTCITLAVSSYLTRDAVKEQAVKNAQESLALADGYVSNLLQYMLYVTNYIQSDSEINATLKALAYDDSDTDLLTERLRVLNKIDNISSVGEKVFVTILQPDGRYFTSYAIHEYDPVNLFSEPWFPELQQLTGLGTYWVSTQPTYFQLEKTSHPYQLSIARTLRIGSQTSQIYGYVVVTILESRINAIFENLAGGQEMMLVDSDGRVLSHRDSERIGEQLDYLTAVRDSDMLELNGEHYLLSQRTLPYAGWQLVSLSPYEQATANITGIFNSVFILLIVLFCVFLALLVYMIQTFTKPLVKLARVSASVQRGNLNVRSGIRSPDEIGSLGASLDQMLDRVGEMIREITLEQTRKRKAELDMLQAQINPHFLFNVLNSIRMKVMRRGDRESAEMISSLSKLLRMTIESNKEMITLHEEIEISADYVLLMNMRQKEKAELRLDVSADVFLQRVPRFLLQPLIENALIHGLQQGAGTIEVTARQTGGEVEIVVVDDGDGMDEATLRGLRIHAGDTRDAADGTRGDSAGAAGAGMGGPAGRHSGGQDGGVSDGGGRDGRVSDGGGRDGLVAYDGQDGGVAYDGRDGGVGAGNERVDASPVPHRGFSGIGLRNVRERMSMIYGSRFQMTIDSKPGCGTRIAITFPLQEE